MKASPCEGKVATIDVHAHFVPTALDGVVERFNDSRWPRVVRAEGVSHIVRDGAVYRTVNDSYDDVGTRLEQLDRLEIDVQVLSALPVMIPVWAEAQPAIEYCRAFNEVLAGICAENAGRLLGLGILPMQDPGAALNELHRIRDLGLVGVELGTWMPSGSLAAPESAQVLYAASELDLPVLLHPNSPQTFGVPCDQALELGVGVGSETARVLADLHLSGVLDRCSGLRLCACHGGGSFLWLWPRLRELAARAGASEVLPRCLWIDTVGLDRHNLAFVQKIIDSSRIVFGTDLPAAGIEWNLRLIDELRLSPSHGAITSSNPRTFLGAGPGLKSLFETI